MPDSVQALVNGELYNLKIDAHKANENLHFMKTSL